LEHGGVPWLPGVADNGVAGDWNSQLLAELLLWSLMLVSVWKALGFAASGVIFS